MNQAVIEGLGQISMHSGIMVELYTSNYPQLFFDTYLVAEHSFSVQNESCISLFSA